MPRSRQTTFISTRSYNLVWGAIALLGVIFSAVVIALIVSFYPSEIFRLFDTVPIKATLIFIGIVFLVWAGSIVYTVRYLKTPLLLIGKLATGTVVALLGMVSFWLYGVQFPKGIEPTENGGIMMLYTDPVITGWNVLAMVFVFFLSWGLYSLAYLFKSYLD